MAALPKISIITPSFNQGQFIQQTIDSVLEQDYPNFEYIVMDGGSTDDTVKILKSYGKRLNWVSKKDKGQTDAINQGLKQASGEVVGYLNSDDYLLPGALNLVGEYFRDHPDSVWVTGDYQIVDENSQPIQSFIVSYKRLMRKLPAKFVLNILNPISQPSTFYRTSALERVGGFDDSLHLCMDYDLWLRLANLQSPGTIHQTLSAFRVYSTSKGGTQYDQQFKEEIAVASRYNGNVFFKSVHQLHAWLIIQSYKLLK